VAKELARLEKEMLQAAKNLEFEKAGQLRDQLKRLRESVFISPL
jgi:excinuclease ABC subunit B